MNSSGFSLQDFAGLYSSQNDRNIADRYRENFLEWLDAMKLPAGLIGDMSGVYIPFSNLLRKKFFESQKVPIIGISGPQGSGKSTFTAFASAILENAYKYRVASFSIDDFYYTRAERNQLSRKVHPLLITRGVPGTHDVSLALDVFKKLRSAGPESITQIPVFDKAVDDRLPQNMWNTFKGRPDIILFEGWCVGARPEPAKELLNPVNDFERESDIDHTFRDYVNEKLGSEYTKWFSEIDFLVMLKVRSFDQVYQWRLLQEIKLREKNLALGKKSLQIMSENELKFFISHYERTTRNMLSEMPSRANMVMHIGDDHRIELISVKN